MTHRNIKRVVRYKYFYFARQSYRKKGFHASDLLSTYTPLHYFENAHSIYSNDKHLSIFILRIELLRNISFIERIGKKKTSPH